MDIDARVASIPSDDRPHSSRRAQCSRPDSLFDPKRRNMIIMKEVIESLAVNPVFVISKIFRVKSRIQLVKIPRALRPIANAGPDIADDILNIRFLHQQDRSTRFFDH